ncbi:hypothetical protein RYZ26_19680 [Terasakiella sp. A23]|uniref:hypothetical protein n=1 Tax=Terasakiella sp. FCG-A23 TaxID=3080561 RepID=UPI002954F3CD|nr:hypothetical protein [Terasakiella sp. A23]MDV7341826.1 hypothetical protein [Terasakiella sp. A23]
MTETYRIQARQNGTWKTQQVFTEGDSYAHVRAAADALVNEGDFEDIRILEVYRDEKTDKMHYRECYSLIGSAVDLEKIDEQLYPHKPSKTIGYKNIQTLTGEWILLDEKQAKEHPLYGIYGWLAFFVFQLVWGPLAELAMVFWGQDFSDDLAFVVGASLFFLLLVWTPLWFLIKKSRYFQMSYTIMSVIILLLALLGLSEGFSGSDLIGIGWLLFWLAYVQFSERVNVTTKHRARRSYLTKWNQAPTGYVDGQGI